MRLFNGHGLTTAGRTTLGSSVRQRRDEKFERKAAEAEAGDEAEAPVIADRPRICALTGRLLEVTDLQAEVAEEQERLRRARRGLRRD